MVKIKRYILTAVLCAAALINSACSAVQYAESTADYNETNYTEAPENLIKNNQYALYAAKNAENEPYGEPFRSYTYDFSEGSNNYMITVTPDETGTGLLLTVEDNHFGFTTFNVVPPENYMVCLPSSQQYANQVCTVIRDESEDNSVPDLLKIDFYLSTFEDESLPYTVSRMYSILDNRLVEVEILDVAADDDLYAEDVVDVKKPVEDYIPDSYLYHTETLKFMSAPTVTVNDDGSLDAKVITYTLNPDEMTMRRAYEKCTIDNPLYYGYAAYAIAGDVYKYFIAVCFNVSDYENYVEIPMSNGDSSQYFFKVDDPRFSTVAELKEYVGQYFDEAMVNKMFTDAPQQYRDIDGELYTLLGDGGMDPYLGKLTITSWSIEGNTIRYYTKQEKFDENYMLEGYVDGGDFVIEVSDSGFTVKEYRYVAL